MSMRKLIMTTVSAFAVLLAVILATSSRGVGAKTTADAAPHDLENKNLYFIEGQYSDGSVWSVSDGVPTGETRIETEFYFASGTGKVMIVEFVDGEELQTRTAKYTMTSSDVVIYNDDGMEFFRGSWRLLPGTSKVFELTRTGAPPATVQDPGEEHPYEYLDANGYVLESHPVPAQTLYPVMSFRLESL